MPEYLVLDVGGSGIKHAVADAGFRLRDKGIVANTFTDHADFVEAIGRLFDPVADRVRGIAISAAGEVDPTSGRMLSGGHLRFNTGTNILASVGARCPVRVTVENDANSALLAEVADGALVGCRDAVVFVLGTGVGGALYLDGRLRHGAHLHAGNASLTLTDLRAPDATLPLGYAGGVHGLTGAFARESGMDPQTIDGRVFFEQLAAGDPAAEAALDRYAATVAALVFNTQQILDVEAFAIGGGISAQPRLIEAIRGHLDRLYDTALVWLPRPDLRVCRWFNDANLRGALVHHLREVG